MPSTSSTDVCGVTKTTVLVNFEKAFDSIETRAVLASLEKQGIEKDKSMLWPEYKDKDMLQPTYIKKAIKCQFPEVFAEALQSFHNRPQAALEIVSQI